MTPGGRIAGALLAIAAAALAPCAARAKAPARVAPGQEAQTWLSVAAGPGFAHVADGDAGGLELRLGYEQEKVSRAGRFVFAQELTLFAGRSDGHTVWYVAPGIAVRRISGRVRYGGGAALGFAVGPDHATGHDTWSLPFLAHGEASVDFYRGERLDGYVELGAGAGYPGFYTASLLVGIRAARR